MVYNPYDLVPMLINGKPMSGRPFEYDSVATDLKEMRNAFGNYIKPTRLATMCPDCGAGMEVNVSLGEPPFQIVRVECIYCHKVPDLADPFENPLDSGRISAYELDPLAISPTPVIVDDGLTAEERLQQRLAKESHSLASGEVGAVQATPRLTRPKRPKKSQEKPAKPVSSIEALGQVIVLPNIESSPNRIVPLESAEGTDEEQIFDDADLAE